MKVLRRFVERNFGQLEFLILQLVSCLRYEGDGFRKSDLLDFLFKNVTKSPKLAANFYWNIRIESETEISSIKNMYEEIGTTFWTFLASEKKFEGIRELLAYQMSLRDSVSSAFDVIKKNSGKSKEKKKAALRKFLKEKKADIESLFENGDFFVFKSRVTRCAPERIRARLGHDVLQCHRADVVGVQRHSGPNHQNHLQEVRRSEG